MDESGRPRITLDSKGGRLVCHDAGRGLVSVDLGVPGLDWQDIPVTHAVDTNKFSIPLDQGEVSAAAVLMGNPHCILFVDDAERAPVTEQGPKLETHAFFPTRINVEFAQVKDPGHIRMRVWERGVGVTLACGTGACATAVAAARRGLTGRKVEVELDGGTLQLEWRQSDDHVLMTGPGVTVFQGQLDLERYGH
jgi:diaminopimelate epimerase